MEAKMKMKMKMDGITKCGEGVDLYEDNSGTTLAIKGRGYCIVAADTRNSGSFNINTRHTSKLFVIDKRMVLSTAGFYADGVYVSEELRSTVERYQFEYSSAMDIEQAAAALHIILYSNRFFPKYSFCCLSGYSNEGEERIYSFDPIGSYEKTDCRCYGSGTKMLQPLLDSVISGKNWRGGEGREEMTEERVVGLVRDVFSSAAETDVKTGDALEVYVITASGSRREVYPLRMD